MPRGIAGIQGEGPATFAEGCQRSGLWVAAIAACTRVRRSRWAPSNLTRGAAAERLPAAALCDETPPHASRDAHRKPSWPSGQPFSAARCPNGHPPRLTRTMRVRS